ncbi:MAG: sigma-70 family RNA polymerase sigma factor [Odoribacteraceae bacterium]|jgi:RNA polymerase sigma factor (sigma-70 family)|nr:sigma-70 family RNA polymerase sigma factor [Odoribacteraceae bacterium]
MKHTPKTRAGSMDDGALWDNFRAGDREAYALIYERNVQALFAHGARYAPDRELLEDAIQDLFVRLYQRKERLGRTDNIKLYLLVALKNDIFNRLARRRVTIPLRGFEEALGTSHPADTPSADEREEEFSHRSHHLNDLIHALPARQREAVHLRFIEEMGYDDIATLMEMNYQSVHNLIQRALKKIRETWKM